MKSSPVSSFLAVGLAGIRSIVVAVLHSRLRRLLIEHKLSIESLEYDPVRERLQTLKWMFQSLCVGSALIAIALLPISDPLIH